MMMSPPDRWATACPDWAERIESGLPLVPELPLFDQPADKALAIFKRLRVPDMPGQPMFGDVSRPWVFALVRAIFGSLDPETQRRAISEFFVMIPKGNAKTTLAAAIMLTAIIVNVRPNAEALIVAPTINVANRGFSQAVGMIRADEDLSKLFHVQEHLRRIRNERTGAVLEVKAADTGVVTGAMATFVLIEETHELARSASADKVLTELRGSLGKRPDGFLIQITTQSKEPPQGIFAAELKKARMVRDGKLRLPLLAILYELPERLLKDDGWRDPKTWAMVNPNLGVSIDGEFLRTQMVAKEMEGPEALALFASQHFNVEIGIGLRTDTWIGAQLWQACAAREGMTLDMIRDRSSVVVMGIDGGGLDDLLGAAVIGRDESNGTWLVWTHAWAQPEVLERRKEIAPKLQDYAADGDVTLCSVPGQAHRELAALVKSISDWGLFPEEEAIGLDHGQIAPILEAFSEVGADFGNMVGIPQGIRLRGAIWHVEHRLKAKGLQHSGSRMMNWVVSNARAKAVGSAVAIEKVEAGKAKIDPLVALFNAAELMGRNPQADDGDATPWDRDENYRMAG